MTVVLRTADGFADRLLEDARAGLAAYREMTGHALTGDVLDIGAHYGAFTLEALEAGAGHVVAIEAAHRNYVALCDNLAANGYGMRERATPMWAAVVETDAETVALRHSAAGNSGQHSVVFHAGHPVSDTAVPVLRFTDLFRGHRPWAYVKIDIEGGEWSVLHDERSVKAFEGLSFIDLEIHPLDAPGYYDVAETVYHVDDVGDWFDRAGWRVTWTVQHPTRLYVAANA